MPAGSLEPAGWLLLAVWSGYLVPLWYDLFSRWLYQRANHLSEPDTWPLLTVIVPARDEGAKIEPCLRSLLASDYPQLQVIAINDRSRDETGTVMTRLAQADARLRIETVSELPSGWLGKNHAMHRGAQAAAGEWLLFTDGDVLFEPAALSLAMKYALARQLDHLCLNPEFIAGKYLENCLLSYFGFLFLGAARPWLIPTRWKRAYIGIGAFNLVRRSAYEAVGGHVPLRLDVMDDVHLGKLLKYSGCRQELLFAGSLVRVRWQDSLWGVIRGLEKNGFASLGYSLPFLIAITVYVATVVAAPYFVVAMVPDQRAVPYWLCLLLTHSTFGLMSHKLGGGWNVFPLLPVGCGMLLFAFWRSAILTLRRGGVKWRETFYPLAELRAARYRPGKNLANEL